MRAFVKLSIYMQPCSVALKASPGEELNATRSPVNSLNEPLCVRSGERRTRRYRACRVLHGRRNVTHKVSGHIARINFNYAAIPRMIMRTVIRRDCICPI